MRHWSPAAWVALILSVLAVAWFMSGRREEHRNRNWARPAESAPLYFHGYECKEDCSGHIAGYEWAREHGITDEEDCSGNSESFIEGCKAYVQHGGEDNSYDSNNDN